MTLEATAARELLHTRAVEIRGYRREDGLEGSNTNVGMPADHVLHGGALVQLQGFFHGAIPGRLQVSAGCFSTHTSSLLDAPQRPSELP